MAAEDLLALLPDADGEALDMIFKQYPAIADHVPAWHILDDDGKRHALQVHFSVVDDDIPGLENEDTPLALENVAPPQKRSSGTLSKASGIRTGGVSDSKPSSMPITSMAPPLGRPLKKPKKSILANIKACGKAASVLRWSADKKGGSRILQRMADETAAEEEKKMKVKEKTKDLKEEDPHHDWKTGWGREEGSTMDAGDEWTHSRNVVHKEDSSNSFWGKGKKTTPFSESSDNLSLSERNLPNGGFQLSSDPFEDYNSYPPISSRKATSLEEERQDHEVRKNRLQMVYERAKTSNVSFDTEEVIDWPLQVRGNRPLTGSLELDRAIVLLTARYAKQVKDIPLRHKSDLAFPLVALSPDEKDVQAALRTLPPAQIPKRNYLADEYMVIEKPSFWVCSNMSTKEIRDFERKPNEPLTRHFVQWLVAEYGRKYPFLTQCRNYFSHQSLRDYVEFVENPVPKTDSNGIPILTEDGSPEMTHWKACPLEQSSFGMLQRLDKETSGLVMVLNLLL